MAEQGSQGFFSPFLRNRRVQSAVAHLRGDVLDVGCGAGCLAAFVPANRYVGVDINEDALRQAKQTFPDHVFASVLPDDRRFDTVVALAVIEHVKQPQLFLQILADKLTQGGQIVLTTPHPSFRRVHDLGALLGLFSRDASEEHETFLNSRDVAAHSQAPGLTVRVSRRFLFGANQLFVLARP
jgi:2-polyprenyl-3-methyl-5-hydroxy-6-metoxy-1,4-benzoquinol methylase